MVLLSAHVKRFSEEEEEGEEEEEKEEQLKGKGLKSHNKVRRSRRKKNQLFYIFSTNAASLVNPSKQFSLKQELKRTHATAFTVQETCFKNKGTFKMHDFNIFEAIQAKEKSGIIIGAHKSLSPVLVSEYNKDFELLVVEVTVNKKALRMITGVGPHENRTEDVRMPFFLALEEEITKAELENKSIYIEVDANSKLGPKIIPNDKHPMSKNGKILAGIIDRHAMFVVNGSQKCKGLITRKRVTTQRTEESSIDLVITSSDMADHLVSLEVDDERKHVITKLTRNKDKVESDHNVLITKFNLNWHTSKEHNKNEMYNLKNKQGQAKFKQETSNTRYLTCSFDDENEDLEVSKTRFIKRLNSLIKKCFTKVRITDRSDKKTEYLYERWRKLQGKDDEESKENLKTLEKELGEKIADNYKKIEEETNKYSCDDGGFHSGKLWNLKKHIFPKHKDPPTAMLDNGGKILTNSEEINELALQKLAVERLRNRPMKEGMEEMKIKKEKLCEQNIKKARGNKTPEWSKIDVIKVLKNLKSKVSRDPLGYANGLFNPKVAGEDMIKAITKLVNRIKTDQIFPKCLQQCNISSIWKRKGAINSFDNYRGVFRVSVFRNVLDRLIYDDEYHNVDSKLTDCNVGSRKLRNIRDHIFVLNAILNSVTNKTEEAIDCQVYDVDKCHDSLWPHEVVNDLFDAGLTNDKLSLLFLENTNAQVAVKS